ERRPVGRAPHHRSARCDGSLGGYSGTPIAETGVGKPDIMSRREIPQRGERSGMPTVSFQLSDQALSALKVRPDQVAAEVRLAAAVKLFELGRLSSGAAADLAGIQRVEFLTRLGDYGVSAFSDTEAE